VGFVLQIPADPTWEPFETPDVLEKDGYYCVRVTSDQAKMISEKLQVVVSMEIQDPDAAGKKVTRFLPDPRTSKGNTWFLWRGLLMSIMGTVDAGRGAFTYQSGMFTGQIAYVKTEAYLDKEGGLRTGVGAWSTRIEWEAATAKGGTASRWPARVSAAPAGGGVGALPGGLPSGLPGTGFPGMGALPPPSGAAMPVTAPTTPQPAAAPMQVAPQPQQAPQMTFAPPAAAPAPVAAPANPFAVPPAAPAAAPPNPFAGFAPAAPQPNGTVPQPTAASVMSSFPGMPPAPGTT
jgi:hypothetical protein